MGEQTSTEHTCCLLEASLEAAGLAVRGSIHCQFASVFSAIYMQPFIFWFLRPRTPARNLALCQNTPQSVVSTKTHFRVS